jgi:hypothetical protein
MIEKEITRTIAKKIIIRIANKAVLKNLLFLNLTVLGMISKMLKAVLKNKEEALNTQKIKSYVKTIAMTRKI